MRTGCLLLLLAILGCSKSKVPKDVLSPEKMQAVYWDYVRADVFANEFIRRDTNLKVEIESARLQNQVFQLHKTTRTQFYSSYDYYRSKPELMKAMLDTIIQKQQAKPKTEDTSKLKRKRNLLLPDSLKLQNE